MVLWPFRLADGYDTSTITSPFVVPSRSLRSDARPSAAPGQNTKAKIRDPDRPTLPVAPLNRFEDISDPKYSPDKNEGITFEEAMATIHVIKSKDAEVMTGMQALTALY